MTNEYSISENDRILRMPEVVNTSGLSRAQIYVMISKGEFPKQIKLTSQGKIAGWLHSEIMMWLQSRIIRSRAGSSGGEQ
jgi:prophage regulatory protein